MKNKKLISIIPSIMSLCILLNKKNDFLFKFYSLTQTMNFENLEQYIKNEVSTSELEQDNYIKIGKVLSFILENQYNSKFKAMEERLDELEKANHQLAESQAKMVEDNLRVIQSAEMVKNIDETKISEFNKKVKQIMEEQPTAELKLKELTCKDYFIDKGIDKTYTTTSKGVTRDLSQLMKLIYNLGGLKTPEYTLSPSANDAEKRKYFADGYEYMMNNIETNRNAKLVYNGVKAAYEEYLKMPK